ncbi:hypothetical protein Tco_0738596 [Tanacetum coccineum]
MLTKPQFFYDHTTKQALEETLILAEDNRSKMILKQQDPMMLEKKSKNSVNSLEPTLSSRPTKVEVPKELPKCLQLETELQTDFIEKEIYDKLFKSFTTLEKHCISLEVDSQLNQEIFQRDNPVSNQSAPSFDQLFELNELKAQSQEKDTVIKKLKERIKVLSGIKNEDKIKQELEEIETINIELDHKSVEISDLNASLQEKVLVITALEDDLRKLKGKAIVDNDITKHPRVKPPTSASGSQPSSNTKKDKIRQTPSSTQKNKVKAHPRKVKSSLKNKDSVVESKGTTHVQHSRLNANSELKCVKLGNACPLTRITTTTEVPLRKPTAVENETPKPVVTFVYSRKPRKSKTNVPDSKSKVRILQISQENGQNRTNMDTGTDRVYKSQEFGSKKGQKSTTVNL